MKLLITGGAGFIGSHLVDAFLADGHAVEVLDDLSSGTRDNLPGGVPLHVHDIRSPEAAALVEAGGFDVLVHHAAQMDVRRSVADPAFDASVNVMGLLNLMEAARNGGVQKVLFASTGGAIYGEPAFGGPQQETDPLRPLSPYGITKLVSERYLDFYEQTHGIRYVALRYGNVYGPRQNPHGEAGVVAIFAERMLDRVPLTVNGDGRQTRDYVFVKDVARANVRALAYDGPGDVFNVGTGQETDVVTLFQELNRLTGGHAEEAHGPAKPGEQQRSVLDASKARTVLGWTPQVALADGLEETVAFFRDKHGR